MSRKSCSGLVVALGCLGQAAVVARAECPFAESQKLVALDALALANFGVSVSIQGDVAVVGASFPLGTGPGKAYVYRFDGTSWMPEAILTASDGVPGDRFGVSVATNGSVTVVGAYLEDAVEGVLQDTGAAYVYRYNGVTWVEEAKLTASDAQSGDTLGISVAISRGGNTIVLGADGDDHAGGTNAGSAYVFRHTGISWTQQAKLTASDAATDDRFGQSVALHGNVAVIGAPFKDDPANNSGAAYVFRRTGGIWTQETRLTAADASSNAGFGIHVAIRSNLAVVAAFTDDTGVDSGAAYIFRRIGGSWVQETKLTASDAAAGDLFGSGISIAGKRVVVGAAEDDDAGLNSGSTYVFRRSGSAWLQECKLLASDGAPGDLFGFAVSLSGRTLLSAAPHDDEPVLDEGSAYIFELIDDDDEDDDKVGDD